MTFMFSLQDKDSIGCPIYRQAQTEKQAIKIAKKDYPNAQFVVLDSYPLTCENCE